MLVEACVAFSVHISGARFVLQFLVSDFALVSEVWKYFVATFCGDVFYSGCNEP